MMKLLILLFVTPKIKMLIDFFRKVEYNKNVYECAMARFGESSMAGFMFGSCDNIFYGGNQYEETSFRRHRNLLPCSGADSMLFRK